MRRRRRACGLEQHGVTGGGRGPRVCSCACDLCCSCVWCACGVCTCVSLNWLMPMRSSEGERPGRSV